MQSNESNPGEYTQYQKTKTLIQGPGASSGKTPQRVCFQASLSVRASEPSLSPTLYIMSIIRLAKKARNLLSAIRRKKAYLTQAQTSV